MLKMLKHDLKAIWPVWRIVAPVILTLSAVAAVIVGVGYAEFEVLNDYYWLFELTAYLIDSYWPMILSAFLTLITVLIVVWYYKNFFTDEGYLTFTLPVSRTNLLNAKILMALIWLGATVAVCLLSSVTYSVIVDLIVPDDTFMFGNLTAEFFEQLLPSIKENFDINYLLFALEIGFLLIASAVSNILLLLMCITVGAVIVKRAKLVLGLGIYYGANAVVVCIFYIGIFIGSVAAGAAYEISDTAILIIFHALLLLGGALFSGLGIGAYFINKNLINKKLNLP